MRKIAVVRRNGLGDLLAAFPLIAYLRAHFPEDKITLFVDKRNSPLLPYLPQLDEVVVFPTKGNKYWRVLKTAWRYRKLKFDLAISAKTSPMKLMNFFLFVLGANKRIAYVDPKKWHSHLVNCPLISKRCMDHQALKTLQLLDPSLQTVPEAFFPKITLPLTSKKELPEKREPWILLTATTTRPESRLPPQMYAAIVNRLFQHEGPFHVLIIGEKKDEARAKNIESNLKCPSTLHFPRNFDDFMVWLDLPDLYFVGDGGVAHIGAALGKDEVVVYGVTNPLQWAPLSKKAMTIFDAEHVQNLDEEVIYQLLKTKFQEVLRGRSHL